MKKIFQQGGIACILSACAGLIYFKIYQTSLDTHFDKILNRGSIIGASIFGCMLIATGYALLLRFKKQNWAGGLNLLIAILSFASVVSPISMKLPLDIASPELFPGLAVPMHFFPAFAFFCLAPFFETGLVSADVK